MYSKFRPHRQITAASPFTGYEPEPVQPPAENNRGFVVVEDPGPDPLAAGAELSLLEVFYGLRYKTFNLGVRLCDRETGLVHTVQLRKQRQALEPSAQRLEALRQAPDARADTP